MKKEAVDFYRSPIDHTELTLNATKEKDGEVADGTFTAEDGTAFVINRGIPDFTFPRDLADIDRETRLVYEKLAEEYDKFASIPFITFKSDEHAVREAITDKLHIGSDSCVLEIGAGDGRGAQHIAKRLSPAGRFYVQELSPAFLDKAIERLKDTQANVEYSVASAMYLPFADNVFDAVHHFGGINTFSDIGQSIREMARVAKPGAKVVFGDENMAPWLRDTEFGKIMMNSNPLLKCDLPLNELPVEARDVKVEWIMMGAFYLLEFTVGDGEPVADYHVPIPSQRGGSHWTRYYGQLEGVTDETKKMAYEAQVKSGKSMTQWLDDVVKNASAKELGTDAD